MIIPLIIKKKKSEENEYQKLKEGLSKRKSKKKLNYLLC